MTHWLKHPISGSALVCVLLSIASPADADLLVNAGQRAMLTVSVTVDGSVAKPQGFRDEVVKWSTRRTFAATVEMAADEPDTMSFSDTVSGQDGPGQALLADIQKQAEACGQDQACQMQAAMQLMNSPAMQETIDAPLRYQAWQSVGEGAHLEFSGSHQETLHTVFYTAARETTDCTLTAPKVSPELTQMDAASLEKWTKVDQETLADSARGFMVEIDSVGKAGVLNIGSPLAMGFGDIKCVQNIGSGAVTSHHSTNTTLLPAGALSQSFQVRGAASDNDVIASGSATVESSQQLTNLGVGFATDVKAPLTIAVRWELKKI